jgi:hypothetical protein
MTFWAALERWQCPLWELESHLRHVQTKRYTHAESTPNNKSINFETGASALCLPSLHSKRNKIWMWFYKQHSRTTKPWFLKINSILALRFLFWPLDAMSGLDTNNLASKFKICFGFSLVFSFFTQFSFRWQIFLFKSFVNVRENFRYLTWYCL